VRLYLLELVVAVFKKKATVSPLLILKPLKSLYRDLR
jgi:hypothetical protein